MKLKKFLKGLSVGARVNETASLKVELLGSPPKKGKARRGRRRSASCSPVSHSAWQARVCRAARLQALEEAGRKATKFVVQLRVTATDRAGNKTVATDSG